MKFVRFNAARYWQEKQRWVFDNKITPDKQLDIEWDAMCELFGSADLHDGHKKAQAMFCCSHFDNNLETDGYILKREQNITANDVLILDIDNTQMVESSGAKMAQCTVGDNYYPIDRVSELLKDHEWMLYTSFNHTKAWHKYRILLPIDTITKQQQLERTASFRTLFTYADPSSFDIGRSFFMPSINPNHPDDFLSYYNKGKRFDWEGIKAKEYKAPERKIVKHTGLPASKYEGKILWNSCDAVQLFTDVGLYQRDAQGGKHEVLCPWYEEHSSSSDTGAAIFTNVDRVGFNCLHGSHRDKSFFDVTQHFKQRYGMKWLKQYYEVEPMETGLTSKLANELAQLKKIRSALDD